MEKEYIHYIEKERVFISQFKNKGLTSDIIDLFQKIIYSYYEKYRRNLPWRKTTNSYHILVSEIMLQQTQVERVLEKYQLFINTFPDFFALAQAPLQRLLKVWQGLGYNRRALFLKRIAEIVIFEYGGILPAYEKKLAALPGIGKATASAVVAFAFNRPTILIETNIRALFIHFFFQGKEKVNDKNILPFLEKTLDYSNPRDWYYALMDYGVLLKKRDKSINKKSAHYFRQTPFEGSNRQIRSMILRKLIEKEKLAEVQILKQLHINPHRIKANLVKLQKEGFIKKKGKIFTLS